MTHPTVICIDGSARSLAAVTEGLEVLAPATSAVVVTVIAHPDQSLVTGTGIAGGTMAPDDFERLERERLDEARRVVTEGAGSLGLGEARTEVLVGDAGTAICDFAEAEDARALVLGSRGHGGFKRAVLGSVSDHVVRNAPCPVVVTGQRAED